MNEKSHNCPWCNTPMNHFGYCSIKCSDAADRAMERQAKHPNLLTVNINKDKCKHCGEIIPDEFNLPEGYCSTGCYDMRFLLNDNTVSKIELDKMMAENRQVVQNMQNACLKQQSKDLFIAFIMGGICGVIISITTLHFMGVLTW